MPFLVISRVGPDVCLVQTFSTVNIALAALAPVLGVFTADAAPRIDLADPDAHQHLPGRSSRHGRQLEAAAPTECLEPRSKLVVVVLPLLPLLLLLRLLPNPVPRLPLNLEPHPLQ